MKLSWIPDKNVLHGQWRLKWGRFLPFKRLTCFSPYLLWDTKLYDIEESSFSGKTKFKCEKNQCIKESWRFMVFCWSLALVDLPMSFRISSTQFSPNASATTPARMLQKVCSLLCLVVVRRRPVLFLFVGFRLCCITHGRTINNRCQAAPSMSWYPLYCRLKRGRGIGISAGYVLHIHRGTIDQELMVNNIISNWSYRWLNVYIYSRRLSF